MEKPPMGAEKESRAQSILETKASRRGVLRLGGLAGLTAVLAACGIETRSAGKNGGITPQPSESTAFPPTNPPETTLAKQTLSPKKETPAGQATEQKATAVSQEATATPSPEFFPEGGLKTSEEVLKEKATDFLALNIYGVRGNLIRYNNGGELGDIYLVREVTELGKQKGLKERQLGYVHLSVSDPLSSRIDFVPNTITRNETSYVSLRWEFKEVGIERIVFINERGGIEYVANPTNGKEQLLAKGGIFPEIDQELANVQAKLPSETLHLELQESPEGGYVISVVDIEGKQVGYWNGEKKRFEEEVILEQDINVRKKPVIAANTLEKSLRKGDHLVLTGLLSFGTEKWYTVSDLATPSRVLTPVPTATKEPTPEVTKTPSVTPTATATPEAKEEAEKLLFVHSSVVPKLSKDQLSLLRTLTLEDLPVEVRPEPTPTPESTKEPAEIGPEKLAKFEGTIPLWLNPEYSLGGKLRKAKEGNKLFTDQFFRSLARSEVLKQIMGDTKEKVSSYLVRNNGVLPQEFKTPQLLPGGFTEHVEFVTPNHRVDLKEPVEIRAYWNTAYPQELNNKAVWSGGIGTGVGVAIETNNQGGLIIHVIQQDKEVFVNDPSLLPLAISTKAGWVIWMMSYHTGNANRDANAFNNSFNWVNSQASSILIRKAFYGFLEENK